MRTSRAFAVGALAREALTGQRSGAVTRWTPRVVTHHAIWLEANANWIAVTDSSLGRGPLQVSVDAPLDRLRCDTTRDDVWLDNGCLTIDTLTIDVASAPSWDAHVSQALPLTAGAHGTATRRLRRAARHCGISSAFAALDALGDAGEHELVARIAVPAARAVVAALANGGRGLAKPATQLVGLGNGLTPSGDDFLVGVAMALAARGERGSARAVHAAVSDVLGARTVGLSVALLHAAFDGWISEVTLNVLTALVRGSDHELDQAVRQLVATGHASGADQLCGLVAGLAVPVGARFSTAI